MYAIVNLTIAIEIDKLYRVCISMVRDFEIRISELEKRREPIVRSTDMLFGISKVNGSWR